MAALLLPLLGCGTRELQVITPIRRLPPAPAPTPPWAHGFLAGLRAKAGAVKKVPPARHHVARPPGIWLARKVYDRSGLFGKDLRLRAIEILYCPSKRVSYTECRLGMGWSAAKAALTDNQPHVAPVPSPVVPAVAPAPEPPKQPEQAAPPAQQEPAKKPEAEAPAVAPTPPAPEEAKPAASEQKQPAAEDKADDEPKKKKKKKKKKHDE